MERKVSVIIPNYNRVTKLMRCLESIANQTLAVHEVIIVDDCSDIDIFLQIENKINLYKHKLNIHLYRNKKRNGANFARNIGIEKAQGNFIAFIDSDDAWLPTKNEVQIKEILKTKSSKPILSSTGRYRVSEGGDIICAQFSKKKFNQKSVRESNFIGTLSSVIVEKYVAKQIGGFDETLRACQDWDFYIRLSEYVEYVGISEPLCIYFDHGENRITHSSRSRMQGHLKIYKKHLKKSDCKKVNISKFLKNIAEIFQQSGSDARAKKYYMFSLYHYLKFPNYRKYKMPKSIVKHMVVIGEFFIPVDIKASRYKKYAASMKKKTSDKKNQLQLKNDQDKIAKLMLM